MGFANYIYIYAYIYIIWINNDKHGLNHIYIFYIYGFTMISLGDGRPHHSHWWLVHIGDQQPRGTPCRFSETKQLKWTQNYLNWSQFNKQFTFSLTGAVSHYHYIWIGSTTSTHTTFILCCAPWCELSYQYACKQHNQQIIFSIFGRYPHLQSDALWQTWWWKINENHAKLYMN